MQTTRKLAALTAAAAALIILGSLFLIAPVWQPQSPAAVYIPAAVAAPTPTPAPAIININTATAEELTTLPGLGPEKAAALVAYRTAHGAFASLADAANVKGISLRMTESWVGLAAVQEMEEINLEKKPESIFINRELSWLDFDSRVLALAKEKTVPLGERIKFAAIFGSNMDEFFMVRVGSLYDQTLLKNNKTDNVTHMTAAEQIAAITPRVAELQAKCDKYFQHLVTALAAEGYRKVDFAKLSKPQEHFWKTYFQRELFPLLSPQIVDSRHPFPFLNNKDIYYIAQLHTKNEGVSYGIVPVSSQFERVLFVKDGETACFAFVEELIAHYAATIFSASTVTKQCLFRVTRNADITVDEGMMDHDVDFRDVMSELLKKRRKLAAVRLQFWPDAPQEIVKFLRDKLVVPADRCYTQTSPGVSPATAATRSCSIPPPGRCRPRQGTTSTPRCASMMCCWLTRTRVSARLLKCCCARARTRTLYR